MNQVVCPLVSAIALPKAEFVALGFVSFLSLFLHFLNHDVIRSFDILKSLVANVDEAQLGLNAHVICCVQAIRGSLMGEEQFEVNIVVLMHSNDYHVQLALHYTLHNYNL